MKLKIWIRSSNELQIPATPNIPNQTTNNEAMEKVLKNYEKQKLVWLRTSLYQSIDTKKNPRLWYSHIAQLITQEAFLYRSHSSCNYVTQPLGILWRMIKS